MICVDIDELTPCLVDNASGEIVETEIIRVRRKSFLSKYNKILTGMRNGQICWKKMKYMH